MCKLIGMEGSTSKHDSVVQKHVDFCVLENSIQDPTATPMYLPIEFLKTITCDFSKEQELGRGGYGVVYKGILSNGKMIAVKKLLEIHILEDDKFQKEVTFLMDLKHPNIVRFIGYCAESRWEALQLDGKKYVMVEIPRRLLCFEYLHNKSLDKYISGESYGLGWHMRYKIIRGISYGLHYIHKECHIIHLDLKPENILMDDDMSPKIADFGMSRLFGHEQSRIITGSREGTLGYMAPEYLANGLISTKSDIFSLGVIIMEVITGHRNYPRICTRESFQHFIDNVVKNWRDWLERTVGCASMETCCQQVYKCMVIGLACVDPDPKKRPSAWDVIQMLNETEFKNWSYVGQALQMFTMKSANLLDDLTIARTGPSTSNTAKQVIAATYVDSILGARSSTSNTESTIAVSCVPVRRSMIEIMAFGVAKILVRGSNMMKSDGAAAGERKIGILAFEVANTIVSGSNLMKSLSEESMRHLNEVVLQSEGVRTLISEHYYQLLIIHQADIREQLRRFALDVIRLGKLCKDPLWRNLDLYFNKLELLYKSREYIILESELACTKEEAISTMQYLLKRAQYTMELYKEMSVLDKFEQEKPTVVQSGITISSVKNQRIVVANLQKKSLWSKKMDDIVQKLVDIVLLVYLEINNAFLHTDEDHYVEAVGKLGETLGSTGLALQYSKVILQIQTLALAFEKADPSFLRSVPKEAKDALYQMLPPCIKLVFYRKLKNCLSKEKTTEEEVRAEMKRKLQWFVPIAESTRMEDADADDVQDFHCNIIRSRSNNFADSRVNKIETLFYANKERADSHILCLVKALHQLVCYERERQLANMRLDIELHRPRAYRTRPR
uniref:Protein kinase domain-containing protein n=1 Tax=Oryza punctata TaxID=4537 RepID=A0A0E0M7K9_ORYPU